MRIRPWLSSLRGAAIALAFLLVSVPSRAIPAFARQYGVSCSTCHTLAPRLNELGRKFLENNFRMPGQEKDLPLAFRRNLPLDVEALASVKREDKAVSKIQGDLDALTLLGGGLLTKRDSFYVHHHLQEEHRHGDILEAWVQHSFSGRGRLNLRLGQFEQPLGFSPEIERLTHAEYLVFDNIVDHNDFSLGTPIRGVALTGGFGSMRFSLSLGRPRGKEEGHGEGGDRGAESRHEDEEGGEEEENVGLRRRFDNVFLRVQQEVRGVRLGAFAHHGTVEVITPDARSTDRYTRLGIDAEGRVGPVRAYGLWLAGTHSNPAATGARGSVNGGFVGAEYLFGGGHKPDARHRYSLYLQYDRAHARGPMEEVIAEGPTFGVIGRPAENWGIQFEVQRRRGNQTRFVLATRLVL